MKFTKQNIDKVFDNLISTNNELKTQFQHYLSDQYKNDFSERLDYVDISEISAFVVTKIRAGQTDFLKALFIQVEQILISCDSYIDNLIIVGLFESIQNIAYPDIDYYFGFDKWLLPLSKSKWDSLIDSWEGQDWRSRVQHADNP